MNKFLNISFLGGDQRQLRVITGFAHMGCSINLLGFEKATFPSDIRINHTSSPKECVHDAHVIILPLPYNSDDNVLNCPFSEKSFYITDIVSNITEKQILFAGRADSKLNALAKLYNVQLTDYANREELAVLNSIPTVEGAIEIAMSKTPYTLHGSRSMVLGYGRIGKLLARSLDALGSDVAVAARKHSDIAWIKAAGYTPVHFKNLEEHIGNCDIIFNTVPVKILNYKILSLISDTALIIDLASKPGGVDFESASSLRRNVIHALSLPGKVAPDTAGDIIMDTICNILEELGV